MTRPRQTHLGLFRLVLATVTIVIASVIGVPRVLAQCEVAKLNAPHPAPVDRFGWTVAIDGDWAIVGVPWDDDRCVTDPDCDTGSALMYQRVGSTWVQRTKLTAPDAAPGDGFGNPVSISGDLVVLGARFVDQVQGNVGAAYVFRRSGEEWVFDAKLTASDGQERDHLGTSAYVAGDVIVVGASSVDCEAGESCGAVYVYRHNGATWEEEAKLTASDASRAAFGISVATDGERIVVGAWSDDDVATGAGSAYVFRYDGPQWIEEAKLLASDAESGDRFGFAVGIDGDSVIVGSMYDDDACPTNPACNSGSAYIFRFDGLAWIEQRKLVAPGTVALDNFGRTVDVEEDTAMVGSGGGAYLYRRLDGAWKEIAQIMSRESAQGSGWSVSLSDPHAIVGAPLDDEFGDSSGSANVFRVLGVPDENSNGVNDVCEGDCNENGVPDELDITSGASADCNQNGVPDECEPDCNDNGIADSCDIDAGTSPDCTADGIPDECEPDCNGNAMADSCDINDGTSPDCTGNGVPDECEPDCNGNGAADSCDIAGVTSVDCNGNGVPDECDISGGVSEDCTGDGVPDECESDCNFNGIADSCDILGGVSPDTDEDGIPDECENWSLCQSGIDFFDYAPHRVDGEAEVLAMELTGALRAPDDEYDRIHRDLELIRSAIPVLRLVRVGHAFAPDQMMVRLEVDLPQQAYDRLNEFYQVIGDKTFTIVSGLHRLTFCDNLYIPAIVPAYEALTEVRYANPNYAIGEGDAISVTPIGTTYRYEFVHGSGDCMSGCICHQYWTVDVLANGSVVIVLSWDTGGCFVGCCLEGSGCVRTDPDTCSREGGTQVNACLDDGDGDGIDDACAGGFRPAPPEPEVIPDTGGFMVDSTKGRFLSFHTTDFGRDQALRVTFVDAPPPYDLWNGSSMWVDEPFEVPSCFGLCGPGPPPPPYMMATLRCGSAAYRDWGDVGIVHVYHEGIVPGGTYRVEAVGVEFPLIFSDPLEMTTAKFGDTVESCWALGCTPPDEDVGIIDALAILGRFASVPGSISLPRADLEPACVDFAINISDVLHSLKGFSGVPYPFVPSAADPCDATCSP